MRGEESREAERDVKEYPGMVRRRSRTIAVPGIPVPEFPTLWPWAATEDALGRWRTLGGS